MIPIFEDIRQRFLGEPPFSTMYFYGTRVSWTTIAGEVKYGKMNTLVLSKNRWCIIDGDDGKQVYVMHHKLTEIK